MTKKRKGYTKKKAAVMTPIDKEHRRVCSVHEVAHALVCVLAGIRFRGIRIYNPGQEPEIVIDGQIVGHAQGGVYGTGKRTISGSGENLMIMLLAGPAATKKLTRKSSFRLLILGSGYTDYAEALRIGKKLLVYEKYAIEAVKMCERNASRLVAKHWKTIRKIAKVLSECGYLSYGKFLKLYEASTASVVSVSSSTP